MSEYPASPRADLASGLVTVACGAAIVVGSWQMDRLEQQGATLHTAPGLWPGVIGLLLAILGGVLAWRSVARAHASGWRAAAAEDEDLMPGSSFALATGLFFIYALLLVGRGLPFWLATFVFVTTFVLLFQLPVRRAEGRTTHGVVVAVICGAATAVIVTLAFEQLFLVRLP